MCILDVVAHRNPATVQGMQAEYLKKNALVYLLASGVTSASRRATHILVCRCATEILRLVDAGRGATYVLRGRFGGKVPPTSTTERARYFIDNRASSGHTRV